MFASQTLSDFLHWTQTNGDTTFSFYSISYDVQVIMIIIIIIIFKDYC